MVHWGGVLAQEDDLVDELSTLLVFLASIP